MEELHLKNRFSFTLGSGNDKREYAAKMLSPFDGYRFGIRVIKMLSAASPESMGMLEENDDVGGFAAAMLKALGSIEEDALEGMVSDLMSKTQIHAKKNGDITTKCDISTRNEFIKWFSDCREDVFPFAFNLIFKNATPFLPKKFQSQLDTLISGLNK